MNQNESDKVNPDTEIIPTTTEEMDMEERFNNIQLTTPKTPYFDHKHNEYKVQNNDDDDDEYVATTEAATTEPSNAWEITTSYDPESINSNITESKNNSFYSNFSSVTREHHDIETNEVNQTRANGDDATTANIIQHKKEKKGKYLVTEITEPPSSETELNTVPPTDSMWALAALKQIESLKTKSGQHRNVTSGETEIDGNTSDALITKSVADWASIMQNTEFTSDNIQMGDVLLTTTMEPDASTIDSEAGDNNIVAYTVNPPIQKTTSSPTLTTNKPTTVKKKITTKVDKSALDDVDLDDYVTTTIFSETETQALDDNTDIINVNSELTPTNIIDFETKETTSHLNENSDYSEGETVDSNVVSSKFTPTESNFILKEPTKSTTIETISSPSSTTAPTTTSHPTTTEKIVRSEFPNEISSSSVPTKPEESGDKKSDVPIDENNEIDSNRSKEKMTNTELNNSFKYKVEDTVVTKQLNSTIEPVVKKMTTERSVNGFNDTHTYDSHFLEEEEIIERGLDTGAIIGITVSIVGAVAIVLLLGFLYVLKKRQKNLTYSQRCRPVGLDAYSLDNVSVYNSVRRKTNLRMSKRSYGNSAFEDPVRNYFF